MAEAVEDFASSVETLRSQRLGDTRPGKTGLNPLDRDMDRRLAILDGGVSDIRLTLAKLEPKIAAIHDEQKEQRADIKKLLPLEGQIRNLPTTLQVFLMIVAVVALVVAVLGAAIAIMNRLNAPADLPPPALVQPLPPPTKTP